MTDDSPHLGSEIDNHKANLNSWIAGVKKIPVSDSRKGVNERFVRDCETFNRDLEAAESPSSHDLGDFDDYANSLEIRYHQITDSTQ